MKIPEKMLKFVSHNRQTPDKKDPGTRRRDFNEIYSKFADEHAVKQASRCSQCGVPFCQNHCPLGNDIPDWLKLVAEGRMREAYDLSSATNNMPEICGRICPQDRLCEGSCVIEQSGHGTVTIGAIEQHITETAWDEGWITPVQPIRERTDSVGIIGAGPAGLAAAEELRRAGVQVTVYDRYDRVGGLLIYGIPNFKLEKQVVMRRAAYLTQSDVQFRLNFKVGRDATFDQLRLDHDAILIATGVYNARKLSWAGEHSSCTIAGLDYLTASNRKGLGDHVRAFEDGSLNAANRNIVVIGGGDTAMDCVRTAIRQGAHSVTCLYRRDRANMPGSMREVTNAEEEGVIFKWLAAPKSILGKNDYIDEVTAVRMELGQPDLSGRRAPVEIPGSEFSIKADMVIEALGFEAEDLPAIFDAPELKVTSRGTLRVDGATLETNLPGVFAAGDIVRGASLVVWAIHDGRAAAASILHQFENRRSPSIAAE